MSNSHDLPPIRDVRPGPPSEVGKGVAIGGILKAIFVVLLCGAVPVLLLVPAIAASREAARRNGCINNMRAMAICVQGHESSRKGYPFASNGTTDLLKAQTVGGHGTGPAASDDGFSWLYQILSYIEEEILYKQMRQTINGDDSQTGPFDVDFVNAAGEHFATMQIPSFHCPSHSGDTTTLVGNVEAATGNYYAIAGTDLAEGDNAFWKTTPNWENGGLPSACWDTPGSQTSALNVGTCGAKRLRWRDIGDGISKTIIAAESREQNVNAWISGASMWVVAASPNSLAADGVAVARSKDDLFIAMMRDGDTMLESDGDGLALNFGSEDVSPPASEHYLQASDWATSRDRTWGPSSEHAGNLAIHVFADAHAQAISAEVDPTIYLRFITRADGDPTSGGGCDLY